MRTIACITAKNEAQTIGPLVEKLTTMLARVIVVDDGSCDGTGEIADYERALVLTHTQSWGIGPSLLHAWKTALDRGADRIVQMDAGGSHSPDELSRFSWRFSAPLADIVIGSRFMEYSRYKGDPRRERLSRLAARMCSLRTGIHISDWTSGYRVFSREAAERLLAQPYRARMHGWQIEVLGHAIRLGLSIREVPITYRAGESSFNWNAAREAYHVWLRL